MNETKVLGGLSEFKTKKKPLRKTEDPAGRDLQEMIQKRKK
jgi:hypothetical protein